MTLSLGRPVPDCHDRRDAAATRRTALGDAASGRGHGVTLPNGEETRFADHALSFHKGLPHDVDGRVHRPSYAALVAAVTGHAEGAMESLPVKRNRTGAGTGPEDPQRWTTTTLKPGKAYRGLVSPLTGHVYDVEGADAGAFGISPAPRVDTDELAAELAELYAMALLRDVPFTDIVAGTDPQVVAVVDALKSMPWFGPVPATEPPLPPAEARRYRSRRRVTSGADLFRGSTPGSQAGPWVSQYLLVGSDTTGYDYDGAPANTSAATFPGVRANVGVEDGFVRYGSQYVDQRSVVAKEGVDWVTSWPAWLDCQNGVDYGDLDVLQGKRRYLTTPRDVATYVHFDQLYQAYLNACLLMLADGAHFPKDPGLPETSSRTRDAFASFGGPHVLALVTEVSSRALKAVWRQKWLHHRRTRPEVVAALLTLHANDPTRLHDASLEAAIDDLAAAVPQDLLDLVSAHNEAQNALPHAQHPVADTTALPTLAPGKNYLLPLAFPEGSPTHPAYGAGHATVAGACVTALKAMFRTVEPDGTATPWPLATIYTPLVPGHENEGGELRPATFAPDPDGTGHPTVTGELDKLAANISIARNMAGVHYYTDYYESVRLGERVTTSILEEQLGMYREPVSVSFTSFDGDLVVVSADGATSTVRVTAPDGSSVHAEDWYGRYSA